MSFTYEKKEVKGRAFAEVTGCEGPAPVLRVPERIGGLPVERIAGNAFSWREDIKEAILPAQLKTLGGFAFYNSPNLKKLTLYDGIEDYSDGVIRHCRQLSEIRLVMRRDNYALLKALLGDNDRFLHLVIDTGQENICLSFPEYFSDYVEDTRARAFHTRIEGAGYRYRECVTARGIRYQEYDEIFIRASSYDGPAAAQIAMDRLRYPHELSVSAGERYAAYLSGEMKTILPALIRQGREEDIGFLAARGLIPEEASEQGIRLASANGMPSVCARLMEAQRQTRRPAERLEL